GIEEGRGGPAIYTIGDDGTRLTRVSQSAPSDPAGGPPRGRGGLGGGGFGETQWSRDGRNIFYMQSGSIYTVAAPAAPATDAVATGGTGRGARGAGGNIAPAASTPAASTPRRIDFTVAPGSRSSRRTPPGF